MDALTPKTHQESVAVFRHGVIGALTQAQMDRGQLRAALKQLPGSASGPPARRRRAPTPSRRWSAGTTSTASAAWPAFSPASGATPAVPGRSPPSCASCSSTSAASTPRPPPRSSSARWWPAGGWRERPSRPPRCGACTSRLAWTEPLSVTGRATRCGYAGRRPGRWPWCTGTSATAPRCASPAASGRSASTACSTMPPGTGSPWRHTTTRGKSRCWASLTAPFTATASPTPSTWTRRHLPRRHPGHRLRPPRHHASPRPPL